MIGSRCILEIILLSITLEKAELIVGQSFSRFLGLIGERMPSGSANEHICFHSEELSTRPMENI